MTALTLWLAVTWPLAVLLIVVGYRSTRAYHITQRRLYAMGSIGVSTPNKHSPFDLFSAIRNTWSQGQNAAALKLRMSEYIIFLVGAFAVPALIGFIVRGPIGAAILGLIGVGGMLLYFRLMKQRYLHLAEQSLPDFLRGISGALRAGTSLTQAMALVAKETPDPLGSEISRVLRRESFGFSLEQTLNELTTRIPSKDLALAVMVINIQREIGGSLADILENIVQTIVARQRLAQEVRALTAQGRMSGWVLTALPFILGLAIWFLDPAYMDPLFHTTTGLIMLGSAAVSVAVGGFVINRLVRSPEL
ncbi:tight adherence protein B [Sulfobacillus thermosulfidooxidans DSM 9293]|uniref:Tight adherence protein B n=1 Tax=Sulfobacillus thermosulfidooxidans (strain DSM 9293 / VKM B-1269 / AT-1) TaxID=929705 RepID=A0A1W1WG00_SULTA|nr:type II secretion system F family protein [Sulfobacillus thermosulfidooxidans]SMC05122.1 tight adherence protein B [Sulfobacillus thermosulfidooxidans DSM 9293]